jgi:hypothetical protein
MRGRATSLCLPIPATAGKAKSLALVPLQKMLLTLLAAIKQLPEEQLRIIEIADIKNINP